MKLALLLVAAFVMVTLSGCTLFGGVSHEIVEKDGTYQVKTTLSDYWNGNIVLQAECSDLQIVDLHGNGVKDKTYTGPQVSKYPKPTYSGCAFK